MLFATVFTKRVHVFSNSSDDIGAAITGQTCEGERQLCSLHLDKKKAWELATGLLDILMEDELTEADVEQIDKLEAKTRIAYMDYDYERRGKEIFNAS